MSTPIRVSSCKLGGRAYDVSSCTVQPTTLQSAESMISQQTGLVISTKQRFSIGKITLNFIINGEYSVKNILELTNVELKVETVRGIVYTGTVTAVGNDDARGDEFEGEHEVSFEGDIRESLA